MQRNVIALSIYGPHTTHEEYKVRRIFEMTSDQFEINDIFSETFPCCLGRFKSFADLV